MQSEGASSVCVGCDVRVMSGVSSHMTISSVSLSCGSAGPCELLLRRKLRKIHTVIEIVKWDTLTAHVIVKYRLMAIVKPERYLTQSFS